MGAAGRELGAGFSSRCDGQEEEENQGAAWDTRERIARVDCPGGSQVPRASQGGRPRRKPQWKGCGAGVPGAVQGPGAPVPASHPQSPALSLCSPSLQTAPLLVDFMWHL